MGNGVRQNRVLLGLAVPLPVFSGCPNARTTGLGSGFGGRVGTWRDRGEGAGGPGYPYAQGLGGPTQLSARVLAALTEGWGAWPDRKPGSRRFGPRPGEPPPGRMRPSCWRRPPSRRPPDSAGTTLTLWAPRRPRPQGPQLPNEVPEKSPAEQSSRPV